MDALKVFCNMNQKKHTCPPFVSKVRTDGQTLVLLRNMFI